MEILGKFKFWIGLGIRWQENLFEKKVQTSLIEKNYKTHVLCYLNFKECIWKCVFIETNILRWWFYFLPFLYLSTFYSAHILLYE